MTHRELPDVVAPVDHDRLLPHGERERTGREVAAILVAITAAGPLLDGGLLLFQANAYVAGFQPRDSCTVVYPPQQPDQGTLRSVSNPPRQSVEAAAPSLIQDQASG